MQQKLKMIGVPEEIHARLVSFKIQPREPLYSVMNRLMENMAQKPKESVTAQTGVQ